MLTTAPVLETNLDAGPVRRGKVRDIYDLGTELLIIATDRISAFDVILPCGIPDKGRVLTRLTEYWLHELASIVPNHFITSDVNEYPAALRKHADVLKGRSMLVRKADLIEIECVVRGYLTGSGWVDYKEGKPVGGHVLPKNLVESQKLEPPIFSPATKETSGHDINIGYKEVVERVGESLAAQLRDTALAIYKAACQRAEPRGVIIADTKFEFGQYNGKLMLIDEVLTPDSSRFWRAAEYRPGVPQNPFDKQLVRNYLLTLDWDKTYPGPVLPDNIIQETRKRYVEAYEMITGKKFE